MIYGKYRRSSTFLAIQDYRLDFLLDIVVEKGQRTWPQAYNFV